MQNKIKLFGLLVAIFAVCVMPMQSFATSKDESVLSAWDELPDDEFLDEEPGDAEDYVSGDDTMVMGAAAVENYNVEGSVFQQITTLEQEKVLMELEKERAQLDLDLDRLAAEKIKLQMEMDTLSGRAEQEQQILQNEKAKLEAEAARIEKEKAALLAATEVEDEPKAAAKKDTKKSVQKKSKSGDEDDIASMYKLVNVMGAGNQLQATLSDLETGQTKRVSVGKTINGFLVKSISLEDGVVFSKDGETQNLNISSR